MAALIILEGSWQWARLWWYGDNGWLTMIDRAREQRMTGSTGPEGLPSPLRQAQLIRTIGEAVGTSLPAGWSSARFVASMTAGVSDVAVWMTTGGTESRAFAPRPASKAAKQLRELMYEPGKGTWFTMTMVLQPQRRADTTFDYDSEPEFTPAPIDDAAFVDDLQRFPREAQHIPSWLQAKLDA